MLKAYALIGLAAVLPGCVTPATAWKGEVAWPDDYSGKNIVPFTEAGAALAAAGAIREMVRQRLSVDPDMFWGCSSPEQGLDVAVYRGPTPGLYYVLVDQRFDRCSGPSVRVLDGWYEYAVTPQGVVVGKAPPPPADDDFFSPAPPSSPPARPEQTPPPAAAHPGSEADTPVPPPSPAPAPTPTTPEAPPEPSPGASACTSGRPRLEEHACPGRPPMRCAAGAWAC